MFVKRGIAMSFTQEYDKLFKHMYTYFHQNIMKLNDFSFDNIYYTNDMPNDILLFCTPKEWENLDNEGVTILPNSTINEPIVLIDITPNNTFIFSRSLFHELYHVYDFSKFSTFILNGSYQDIYNHKYFECYRRWCEFRSYSYADFYALQYMDYISSRKDSNKLIEEYDNRLDEYINKLQLKIVHNQISAYDLSMIFGYVYCGTFYNKSSDKKKYTENYIKKLFPESYYDKLILYNLYVDSDQNESIFENLQGIYSIDQKLFHREI